MYFLRNVFLGLICTYALAQFPTETPYAIGLTPLAGYYGTNVKKLISALSKPSSERGKFESESDYQQRVNLDQTKALFGVIYKDSLLALPILIETTYDFDKGLFTVKAPKFKKIDVTDMPFSWGLKAHQIDVSTSSEFVTKQNAYGAKVQVEQFTTVRTLVVLKLKFRDEVKLPEYKWSGIQYDLKMTPDTAKSLDANIRLIIVGTMIISKIIQGKKISDMATIDNPRESFEYQQIVGINPKSIILYDSKSGTIYKQFNCID